MKQRKLLFVLLSLLFCILLLSACNSEKEPENTNLSEEIPTTTTAKKNGKTIPDLIIKTESGRPIESKEDYLVASVTLSGATDMPFELAGAQIRGRGNSTWNQFDKKPYRLKFDEKVDLMGMGAARDYILLSNAMDMTMMHNYAAFTIMSKLSDEFTPECAFVHLHINGQYMGVYLVTERIEQDKERLDIGKGEGGKTDVGYLVEFGGNIENDEKPKFTLSSVTYKGTTYAWRKGFRGVVKSPDETVCTDAQLKYIDNYIEKVNKAIYTKDFKTFSELCDVDSFVCGVLVNELFLNNDFDFSMNMYKKAGGKLYFGPIWDFDQACGISTKSGGTMRGWTVSNYPSWITSLLEIPEFYELVKEKWIENYDLIHSLVGDIYAKAEAMDYDIKLNFRRWDVLGKPYWRMTEEMADLDTYEGFLDRLAWWLDNRIVWIDKEFGIYEFE